MGLAALHLAKTQAEADLHEAMYAWLFEVTRDIIDNPACDHAWTHYQDAGTRYADLGARVAQEMTL
jgi:hypothetical protein